MVADVRTILEDTASGFGEPVRLTDPYGHTATLTGFAKDIAQAIDPDTGMLVSGRVVTCAFAMATLAAAGFADLPQLVEESSSQRWCVELTDARGIVYRLAVREARPNRHLGVVVCILEFIR
jgi:hypothetical protein